VTLEPTLFQDRLGAGLALAHALEGEHLHRPLVLGIARGGMAVAAEVARRLDAELDLLVVLEITTLRAPEVTVGSVAVDGTTCYDAAVLAALRMPASSVEIEREVCAQRAAALAHELRAGLPVRELRGREIVVVDDGVHTGVRMRAALRSVARAHPARLIAAVPVGARESCLELRLEFPELVTLHEADPFPSVQSFYARFPTIEDAEVSRLLRERVPTFALHP
jgi:predicted phosphoribosyltransferase